MHDSALTLREFLGQIRFVMAIEKRDLPKRLLTGVFILWCLFVLHSVAAALLCLVVIALGEGLLRLNAYFLPSNDGQVLRRHIFQTIAFHSVATIAYCLPVLFLFASERITGLLIGALWLGGVTLHVVGVHALIRIFNWSLILPPAIATVWAVSQAYSQSYSASVQGDLIPVVLASIIFCFNLIDVIRGQHDSRTLFSSARLDAQVRLRQLEYLSRHDVLTGLLNRGAYDELGRNALSRLAPDECLGVMQIDLNGFKPINDAYGHTAGDVVLRKVAEALITALPDALVARLGGDEFGVLVPKVTDADSLQELAQDALTAVSQPITHNNRQLVIGAAIGVTVSDPGDTTASIQTLRAEADQAMYVAKSARSEVPPPVLYRAATFPNRWTLEDRNEILDALKEGHLRPAFQPIIRLSTGNVAGFEALARWHLPDGTIRRPQAFLDAIKQFGLQYEFTIHMIRTTLEQIQQFIEQGRTPPRISVNIMQAVFATQSGITAIEDLLRAHAPAAQYLDVELTEDIVIERYQDRIRDTIQRFARFGVRFFLDDFGTGYASFEHLRSLPIDVLKIDKKLVKTLGEDAVTDALVKGFLTIAKGIGAAVVAEGVETERQADQLREMGCGFAQGYFFGHSMGSKELLQLDLGPKVPGRENLNVEPQLQD